MSRSEYSANESLASTRHRYHHHDFHPPRKHLGWQVLLVLVLIVGIPFLLLQAV